VTARRVVVKITANFERNLVRIRDFLSEAGAQPAFAALVEHLEARVIPAIERFPDIGADFTAKAPLSREGQVLFERLVALAGPNAGVRQLVEGDYIILYAVRGNSLFLLSIKHHRQLSFDFAGHWP
jgi:ParE toxin of type II toxin-antitoxin system, parDE